MVVALTAAVDVMTSDDKVKSRICYSWGAGVRYKAEHKHSSLSLSLFWNDHHPLYKWYFVFRVSVYLAIWPLCSAILRGQATEGEEAFHLKSHPPSRRSSGRPLS